MEAHALNFCQHDVRTSPRIDYLPNFCPQRRSLVHDLRSVVDRAVFFRSSSIWAVYNHVPEEAQRKSSFSVSCSFLSSEETVLVHLPAPLLPFSLQMTNHMCVCRQLKRNFH